MALREISQKIMVTLAVAGGGGGVTLMCLQWMDGWMDGPAYDSSHNGRFLRRFLVISAATEEGATFLATKPIYILAGKKARGRYLKLSYLYDLCDRKKEGKHA